MTLIFAHRGAKGTHPENTLCAFEEAIERGVDGIELDVQMTRDNELVVIHDEKVNRTTNGKGLVRELTLKEIKKLDAGKWFGLTFINERVPTFSEVLQLIIKKNFIGVLNIELKTDEYDYEGIEQKILDTLAKKAPPCQLLMSSFNIETMKRLVELNESIEKAIILDDSKKKIDFCQKTGEIEGMHPSIRWVNKNKATIKQFDKKIRPWTVNSETDMKLCFDLELAGFFTDFPQKAKKIKDQLQDEKR